MIFLENRVLAFTYVFEDRQRAKNGNQENRDMRTHLIKLGFCWSRHCQLPLFLLSKVHKQHRWQTQKPHTIASIKCNN